LFGWDSFLTSFSKIIKLLVGVPGGSRANKQLFSGIITFYNAFLTGWENHYISLISPESRKRYKTFRVPRNLASSAY